MARRLLHLILLGLLLLVPTACGDDRQPPPIPPRPVTWFKLKQLDPGTLARHTGSVESWKKELLGFEVRGRVAHVLEPGLNVDGRVQDLSGRVISEGEVVAELETRRFRISKEQAEANLGAAKAQADVMRREIENTIPQRLEEAKEERDFKEREFRRYESLAEKGVESVAKYDEARTDFRMASSAVSQLEALLTEKTAELTSREATVQQFGEELNLAEKNLADTQLFSPFSGQISKVHVIPGGFVTTGQPVVTVQMMDPMKVEVAVSPQTDEQIYLNDTVRIHVRDGDEPLEGSVYLKATVADSATRTFMITLLVRNRTVEVGVPKDAASSGALKVPYLTGPTTRHGDATPPWFVEERSLHKDGQGTYVWVADGLTQTDLGEAKPKVFKLKKVRLKMGEEILPILQLFSYREVADLGDLDPSRDLVAYGVPEEAKEGDEAYFSREVWLLRPGQLVHVDLRRGELPAGMYVPMHCIAKDGDRTAVFMVEKSPDGVDLAKRVDVTLHEGFGEFRRIEASDGQTLEPDTRLVLDGAHYLQDGDAINAFQEREVRP